VQLSEGLERTVAYFRERLSRGGKGGQQSGIELARSLERGD